MRYGPRTPPTRSAAFRLRRFAPNNMSFIDCVCRIRPTIHCTKRLVREIDLLDAALRRQKAQ
jgi:hypothetical protein